MKTSVISEEFRARYLCIPGQEERFEGRAIVFDGSEDYHARINDPELGIDEHSILVIRGAGPVGWPGSAEVVNMQPPDALLRKGITSLPTIGDGRQSGTADSPSILNASPESAVGGGLAWLAHRRYDTHRYRRRHLRHAGQRCRDRCPQACRHPSDAAEHDAVAADLSRDGGPVGGRRSDRGRRPIPQHLARDAATQPLGWRLR